MYGTMSDLNCIKRWYKSSQVKTDLFALKLKLEVCYSEVDMLLKFQTIWSYEWCLIIRGIWPLLILLFWFLTEPSVTGAKFSTKDTYSADLHSWFFWGFNKNFTLPFLIIKNPCLESIIYLIDFFPTRSGAQIFMVSYLCPDKVTTKIPTHFDQRK